MRRRLDFVIVTALISVILGMLLGQWWSAHVASGIRVGISLREVDRGLEITGVEANGPAERAGFLPGDVLIAVEGHEVVDFESLNRWDSLWQRGVPIHLRVVRGDQPIELAPVPGTSFPWFSVVAATLSCLAYLAIGLIAFGQSPNDLRVRLLFLFSVAVALEFSLPATLPLIPGWTTIQSVAFYLITGLQMGLELHLASVIPQPAGWFTRSRLLPAAYYLVGFAVGGTAAAAEIAAAAGGSLGPVTSGTMALVVNTWALLVWSLVVAGILAIQVSQAPTSRARQQAVLVLAGIAPWTIYQVVYQVVVPMGGSAPYWMEVAQPAVLIAFPIAVFFAIFKFHLLDIEFVLRRSLVFVLVTASLAALVFMAFGFGTVLFTTQDRASNLPVAALALGMLVLGLSYAPMRRWVQDLVDRRFFPESREMARMLTALAGELPGLGSLPAMGRHLVHDIVRVFGVRNATLLVADPISGVQVTLASSSMILDGRFGETLLIEPDDPGIEQLVRAGQPLPADQVGGASPALARRLHAFDAELVVGLTSGTSLVGVLLLGPKNGGERFQSSEVEMLSLFSHAAATVFENARLYESATYEGLTGLMRRETIIEKLDAELKRSLRYRRPLSVGMVDIDRFKRVNDEFGHLAGDAMLKHVAHELQAALRSTDAIGRYGGEEFLFILPETEVDEARVVAEKLRASVEALDAPVTGAPSARVTVSIGVATIDHEQVEVMTAIDLIARADDALLKAKREGRNRVVARPVAAA